MGVFEGALQQELAARMMSVNEKWERIVDEMLGSGPITASGIESAAAGYRPAMATTPASTREATSTGEAPTRFSQVYAECRDVTEKLDCLAYAVDALGDSKLARDVKDWKDRQLATNPLEAFGSLIEMVNEGPAESITHAKQLAEEAGLDLPEEPEGDVVENQAVGAPEGSDAKDEDKTKTS